MRETLSSVSSIDRKPFHQRGPFATNDPASLRQASDIGEGLFIAPEFHEAVCTKHRNRLSVIARDRDFQSIKFIKCFVVVSQSG